MRIDVILSDFIYAIRRLRSAPLFVTMIVLTFALGIGANVAVFSVLNAVVLRPLPFANGPRLVVLQSHDPQGDTFPVISSADASDIRAQAHRLSAIATATSDSSSLLLNGKPFTLNGLDVMPDYTSMLALRPEIGRLFTAADGKPGVNSVVISDEIWKTRFNADPRIVGRSINLGGRFLHVVGVLEPGQLLADPGAGAIANRDFLETVPETGDARARGQRVQNSVALLAPDTTLSQANSELALISKRLQQLYPHTNEKFWFDSQSFTTVVIGPASAVLWIIFVAVIGILVISCVNVGNMLAARWTTREREIGVRRALGASTARISLQLLIETAMLATLGALCGVGLAFATLRALSELMSTALPRAGNISIDGFSLLYALVVVVIATFLAGLLPISSLGTLDLQSVLKSAGRGGDDSRRHRLRSLFVILEIALSLALVIVAGLMLRSFVTLVNTPLGIRPQGVVASATVSLSQFATPASRASIDSRLLSRLRALPGISDAAVALTFPLAGIEFQGGTPVVGRTYASGSPPMAWVNTVSPSYFDVLGIPVIKGRAFNGSDLASSAPVVIVNQSFVSQYLQGMNPIGARLKLPTTHKTATIVGVVGDERLDLTSPLAPHFYQPISQYPPKYISAIVHAPSTDSHVAGREVQSAFAATLPEVQPPDTQTMPDLVAISSESTRFATELLGILALIALVLALTGIFGVVSFSVTQRVHEFGVRIALGATATDILRDVGRRALVTTAVGVAIGLTIAALAARAVAPLLNRAISPFDPWTFVAVVALMFISALLASLQPALRATRVEPSEALRYE